MRMAEYFKSLYELEISIRTNIDNKVTTTWAIMAANASLIVIISDKIYSKIEEARHYKETLLTNQGEDIDQKKEEIENYLETYIDGMLTRVYDKCIKANYNQNKKQKRVLINLNVFTFLNIILTIILYVIIYIGGQ